MTSMDNLKQLESAIYSALEDLMLEDTKEFIRSALLDSVSSVITFRSGKAMISVNCDDYGLDYVINFILKNSDDSPDVFIDGVDIFDFD